MKNNPYAPWHVPLGSAPESEVGIFEYMIQFAVLAPSSHNTQPWRFVLRDHAIELHYADERRLRVSDPKDRQLYLSLGAALENLVRTAESLGRKAEVSYRLEGDLAATVKLGAAVTGRDFRQAMAERRSTRLPFSAEPLSRELVRAVKTAGQGEMEIGVFEGPAEVEAVARINGESSGRMLADPGFRAELSGWVRNNWTRQPDGMPGFVQGIPGPVSLLAPVVVKNTNIGPEQARKDHAMFKASPAVVVLSVAHDEKRAWLEAGRTCEAIWLEAELAGYQVSALGSAVEDERGADDLKDALHLKGRAVVVMRLGKTAKVARHSPRRSATEATSR